MVSGMAIRATAVGWTRAVWRQGAYLAPLVVLMLMVFGKVCSYEFLTYDDPIHVYENSYVTNFSAENLGHFWQGPERGLYVPATYTLWSLLAALGRFWPAASGAALNPQIFHTANLFLHIINTVLVFMIGRRLFHSGLAAGIGAALFAMHPVQVEAVAWVSGTKDLLAGLFCFTAIWLYVLYAQAAERVVARQAIYYFMMVAAFLLALLSKPSAVVLPLAAAGVGAFLLKRNWRRLALELCPLLLIGLPFIAVTRQAQAGAVFGFVPVWWQRLLIAGDTITFYLFKLVFPVVLTADYGRTPQVALADHWLYLTALLPLLGAAVIVWKDKEGWWRAAAILFVSFLLPVSGLLTFGFQNLSTVADRYLYLAMLGPALALGRVALRYDTPLVKGVCLGLIVLFGVKSGVQARYWRDSFSLYQHMISANPQSWFAYNNLGNLYHLQKKDEQALLSFRQAIAVQPEAALSYVNMAAVYSDLGEKGEAAAALRKALELDPADAGAYTELADIERSAGRLLEALPMYKKAIALDPEAAKAYAGMGAALAGLGRKDEAVSAYQKAVALLPALASVYNNLGAIYQEINKNDLAEAAYLQAIQVKPEFAEAYNNLGFLYASQGRTEEAITLYRQALTIYPGHPTPMRNLGLAYAGLGEDEEALVWLEKAIVAAPKLAPAFNDLAKVYLRMQRYDLALKNSDQARALGLVDPELQDALQPYRQEP